jgi:hypothetical protein
MKSIVKKVMQHSSLQEAPPVLVDIGASGELPQQWKLLAPYSICVAFDADTRDFKVSESENGKWKKLYSLNRVVAANASSEENFYLTKSPYCSSTLRPDSEALRPWAFRELFEVEKIVKLPTINLQSAMESIGLDYIDWYKTDSQGTDLRIFESLPDKIITKIIAAEFEPGVIDAYIGEDKLHQVMSYMEKQPFWVSHMEVKGSQRIDFDDFVSLNFLQRRYLEYFLKAAPGWCEISYLNTLKSLELSCREYLLGWMVATLKEEHGVGLHISKSGSMKFSDPIFDELHCFSLKSLSSAAGYASVSKRALKKLVRFFI